MELWYAMQASGNGQGLVIAEGSGRNVAVTYDERDARLVAAAPAMGAALAKVRQFLENEPNLPNDGWMNEVLREVRAAIAAADVAA